MAFDATTPGQVATIGDNDGAQARWDNAPIEALVRHIVTTYHEPLRPELLRLEQMAEKVNRVHSDRDPERLETLKNAVVALRADLEQHLMKEEQVLFPMILSGAVPFAPMAVMESEHDAALGLLREIRTLTHDFVPPDDACETWRGLWAGLEDLERALHEHIHLENDVLHARVRG